MFNFHEKVIKKNKVRRRLMGRRSSIKLNKL